MPANEVVPILHIKTFVQISHPLSNEHFGHISIGAQGRDQRDHITFRWSASRIRGRSLPLKDTSYFCLA